MSDSVLTAKPKRLVHLDILRLLAIFLVIFNHTGNQGYMLFANEIGSPLCFLYMAASIFCKIAVPLFFMISGALLLPKEETLKQLFTKRILRMLIVLMLVSVPYYFWLHRSYGTGALSFLKYVYSNSATTALWYLYSYIALLLVMPFLRSMVKNMKQKDFVYLIIGYVVFVGVLPSLEYLLCSGGITLHEDLSPVFFISQNVFYALVGYYIEHILDKKNYNKKNVCLGIALSIIAIAITCFITYHQIKTLDAVSGDQAERFFNCFICIPTITVYFIVKNTGAKINKASVQKVISILGSAVFGVYLIEKFLRSIVSRIYYLTCPFVGSLIASWIWCLATLCLGLIVVVPLKHIPVVKKIVNKFI